MLHRYVLLVGVVTLGLIASGAYLTSAKAWVTPMPETPQPATGLPAPVANVMNLAGLHTIAAGILGVLTLGLAVWLTRQHVLAVPGWIAFAVLVLDSLTGWVVSTLAHAALAPIFFATIVAIAVFTSPGWKQTPELVDDGGRRSIGYLAMAAPPIVLVQIVLGAAYRHKLTGVMPHMAGAMIASLVILIGSMLVTQQYGRHQTLRRAATALMSILLTQVALGVGAFTMQLLDMENTPAAVAFAVLHVTTGSLALGASLVFAIQVRRHIRGATVEVRSG